MIPNRLSLVNGNLELLTAALAGGEALEALLGTPTKGWFGTGAESAQRSESVIHITRFDGAENAASPIP